MPCRRSEYEKINCLGRSDPCVTSSRRLRWRTGKQVIAPPPPPPPPEFFRSNEFDIGAFGTYATGVGSSSNSGRLHAWGGGIDLTYWFPWKYAGVRFQGTGASIRTNNGSQTKEVTLVQGFAPVSVTAGGGSVA